MTAYEVSISKLAAYENAENFDTDEEFNLLGYVTETDGANSVYVD